MTTRAKLSGTTAAIAQIVLPSRDLEEAERFYVDQLGLSLLFRMPNVVALDAGGIRILLAHKEGHSAAPDSVLPYFRSCDVDKDHPRLVAAGAEDRGPPHCIASFDGIEVWIGLIADPSGNVVGLMEERICKRANRSP
jgi:catechol 2,3-dioxygenase-like lactoylglutathione lyase family enzyme